MQINREQLLNQLESVLPGLSPREIIEQSSCVVFKDGKIITYNDEVSCSQKTELDITGAVQAMPLVNILRRLKEDELEIESDGIELLIKGKKRKTGIRMEKEILLPIDSIEVPDKWNSLPDDFIDAVSIIQECAGKDETQFVTTCIHIHPDFIESSDNEQIARYKIKTKIKESFLVRKEALKYIVSLNMTKISETENWVHFKNSEGLVLSCRRYLEEYPDWSKVLKVNGKIITLPKGLKDAAERCEVFSAEMPEDNQVTIFLKPGKLKITGKGVSGWHTEFKNLSYKEQAMSFTISPKLLAKIVDKHNECEITQEKLKVDGGKFVYVTALGLIDEKEGKE